MLSPKKYQADEISGYFEEDRTPSLNNAFDFYYRKINK
jgi:hypothetical protein